MASAASLKIFLLEGDNPPRNRKTNNAGIKVGIDPLIPPVSAPMIRGNVRIANNILIEYIGLPMMSSLSVHVSGRHAC
jgi:hypothetical protein